MSELTRLLEVVQTAGVLFAVFYYIMTLQNSNKIQEMNQKTQQITLETRQAQLFMELYKTSTNYEFLTLTNELLYTYQWENYDDFLQKFAPETNPEMANKIFSVMSFFEGIGVLLEQELINMELVYKLMHPLPVWIWNKMLPIIEERRKRSGTPETYEWFEYLVSECIKYEKEIVMEKIQKRDLRAWTS